MNILFVSAEVSPFVSVGGLSQVSYFLPKAIKKHGHDIRIFTARHGTMKQSWSEKKLKRLPFEVQGLSVPCRQSAVKNSADNSIQCDIRFFAGEHKSAPVYFLENNEYFELRANVFGYGDDHQRFNLLSRGCLEWLRTIREESEKTGEKIWWPDIIHCQDWHTAYVIDIARRDPRYASVFQNTAFVLTVHNLKYQGNADFRYLAEKDYDNGESLPEPLLSLKLHKQNPLMRGMLFADAITTVSKTHAKEVLTPEYAEGLDKTLLRVQGKLSGILNGLDTHAFNPATDKMICKNFSKTTFRKMRVENKRCLQEAFSLPIDKHKPLLAFVGRLAEQKGLDLMLEVLPHLLFERPDVQVIVLGVGDDRYREALHLLQEQFPEQIGLHLLPDFRLPRKVFAGADIFLIPSLFEPGGIVALEAMRYGSVPIVRKTGGLADIVNPFDIDSESGNGFRFLQKDAWSLYGAVIEALTVYKSQDLWMKLVENCLRSDFSWDYVATEYEHWYEKTISDRKKS